MATNPKLEWQRTIRNRRRRRQLAVGDMVLFVHRPEYYHIYQDEKGNDLHGMAQIIIAKHRKGATGDVLLNFRGEFTRFQDPETSFAPQRMNILIR